MVSPSKPHHSRVASQKHLRKYLSYVKFITFAYKNYYILIADKCKLVKGPRPLTHFKFYLDIEKHLIEKKIEKTIRELGGVSNHIIVTYNGHLTFPPELISVHRVFLSEESNTFRHRQAN